MIEQKITTQEGLLKALEKERSLNRTVGFTNGCFDILHPGHVKYLEEAKKRCDVLVVGVNSDSSVKRLKGPERPVNGSEYRTTVLAAVESVDFITIFEEDTPEELIKKVSPEMLFKGGDWDKGPIVGADHVKANEGEVKIVPYVEGYSTTKIIEKIKKSQG